MIFAFCCKWASSEIIALRFIAQVIAYIRAVEKHNGNTVKWYKCETTITTMVIISYLQLQNQGDLMTQSCKLPVYVKNKTNFLSRHLAMLFINFSLRYYDWYHWYCVIMCHKFFFKMIVHLNLLNVADAYEVWSITQNFVQRCCKECITPHTYIHTYIQYF